MGIPFEQAKMSQSMLAGMDDETFSSLMAAQSSMMGGSSPSPMTPSAAATSGATAMPTMGRGQPSMADVSWLQHHQYFLE
jgi:hypothetical protein